jgi:hypothetical protein
LKQFFGVPRALQLAAPDARGDAAAATLASDERRTPYAPRPEARTPAAAHHCDQNVMKKTRTRACAQKMRCDAVERAINWDKSRQ